MALRTTTALLVVLIQQVTFAESPGAPRTICVAPASLETIESPAAPGLACPSGKLTLQIDAAEAKPWPRTSSMKINGMDPRAPHKVVVMCDGKPQQSFRFRFSEYKSGNLCLFLNDLYGTVQLEQRSQAPWCRCD